MAVKKGQNLFEDLDTPVSPLTSVGMKVEDKKDIDGIKNEVAMTVDAVEKVVPEIVEDTITPTVVVDQAQTKEPIEELEVYADVEVISEDIKQVEYNEKAIIYLQSKNNNNKKKYANFYLRESTLNMIAKLAGKGKGKTGYNKSELVDVLLEEALSRLKVK